MVLAVYLLFSVACFFTVHEHSETGSRKGKDAEVTRIFEIGKIDKSIFAEKYGELLTDEVIVTEERMRHIQERHAQDYALFLEFGSECIQEPDLVLSDEKNKGTVFMIKRFSEINLNVVMRLVLEGEDDTLKNSVMTFWRIRDRNVQKLVRKNEILYKRE